jgi:4-hydroxy-tetrahydrodipicolinate synthase
MVQLANIPNIAGVKEASGDINQMAAIAARAPKGFVMLSGDDAMTLPAMSVGAKGVISVASNLVPERMIALVDAMAKGEVEKARKLNQELLPLFSALFIETNPIPVKTAMRLMGRPAGPFRLPLCDMTPANLDGLKKVLTEYKLI